MTCLSQKTPPRVLEISFLACEYEADVRSKAQTDGPDEIEKMMDDLRKLQSELHAATSLIDDSVRKLEHLCVNLWKHK